MDWKEIVKGFADPIEESKIEPAVGSSVYDDLIKEYAGFETQEAMSASKESDDYWAKQRNTGGAAVAEAD